MLKVTSKEVVHCDICEKEAGFGTKCLICGKDFCSACAIDKKMVITFNHAVSFCGCGDGHYCDVCLRNPIPLEHVELLNAYKKIDSLRKEYVKWNKDFDSRRVIAESELQAVLKDYKEREEDHEYQTTKNSL